jgi:hypothetical protein
MTHLSDVERQWALSTLPLKWTGAPDPWVAAPARNLAPRKHRRPLRCFLPRVGRRVR